MIAERETGQAGGPRKEKSDQTVAPARHPLSFGGLAPASGPCDRRNHGGLLSRGTASGPRRHSELSFHRNMYVSILSLGANVF